MHVLNAVLLLVLCVEGRCQQACGTLPTVGEIVSADPDTSLTAAWLKNTNATALYNAQSSNVTVLVATDAALREGVLRWANMTLDAENAGINASHGILAMYNTLEGRYSAENFKMVPSINSILGRYTQEDYVVEVTGTADSALQAIGVVPGEVARVLNYTAACNGFVIKVDKLLLPAKKFSEIDISFDRIFQTQLITNGSWTCPVSLLDEVAAVRNVQKWTEVLQTTGMVTPLRDDQLSSTIFVPLDQTEQVDDFFTPTADSVMYNMLLGAWCPDELIAAGSKNSMLGEYTDRALPLRFTNDSGTLVISGDFGSSRVLRTEMGCHSVIFVTDVPLYLPRPAIAAPLALPTLPIRHITCNPVTYKSDAGGSDGSSATALAVGLGVGLGCAVLLAGFAGLLFYRHRRSEGSTAASSISSSFKDTWTGTPTNTPPDSASVDAASAMETGTSDAKFQQQQEQQQGGDTNQSKSEYNTVLSAPASTIFESLLSFPTVSLASEPVRVPTTPSPTTAKAKSAASDASLPSAGKRSVGDIKGQLTRLGAPEETGMDLWELDQADVEVDLTPTGKPIELGRGSFGAVYRGTLRGVQPAAIKVMNADVGSDAEAAFQREAAILKHVNRDRNVVQLYGTCKMPDGKLLLVTELVEGGDLRRALNNPETAEALAWQHGGKSVALDITRGLTALHAINVIHRDLKSKNILLTSTLTAKVADVGIAAVHSQGYLTASAGQVIGTLAWSAPELLLGGRCTEKVDIYSLGIVLWELATGKTPQRGFTQQQQPSDRCPAELVALIAECTEADARKRPNAKEVYARILEIPPLIAADKFL